MLLIYIICTITLFIYPILKEMADNKSRVYNSKVREFRIATIQKHYPELKNLSWHEIERDYSVSELYNQIR